MTTQTVERISSLKFIGNLVPISWFYHIKHNGSPDLISIVLLSDIVYWYRAKPVRDEYSGKVVSFKQKFKADKLQRSYQQFADQFNFSRQQVERAIKRLKKLGLITTEIRILAGLGKTLFLEPVAEEIIRINFDGLSTAPHITGNISPHITRDMTHISPVIHHTKTTTIDFTTEIKNNNNRQTPDLPTGKKNDKITVEEKRAITKKITAMKKANEVPYPTNKMSIEQLCEEVEVHVANRDKTKLESAQHAINAAAKLIKQGRWGTPARLVRQRDEEHQKSKRRFLNTRLPRNNPFKSQINELYA